MTRVCHVSRGLCPRMVKLAYVQKKKGMHLSWIGRNPPRFENTIPFEQIEIGDQLRFGGLKRLVDALNGSVDLFHVHTHLMDSSILDEVIENTVKPVVWDKHDEPEIVPRSDAKWILDWNSYRSYCPLDWFASARPGSGAFIATGLSDVPGHFRYWVETFRELGDTGHKVTLATASKIVKAYSDVATILEPMDIRDLIELASGFDVGICGSPHPNQNMLAAKPNKLFEYIAAGIPVICFGRMHEMVKIIEEYGLGVAISEPREFPKALEYIQERGIRDNVVRFRQEFTMEAEEVIVDRTYQQALA